MSNDRLDILIWVLIYAGLFVAGEANFSDHGANRLGASALMQGLADGYFVIPYTIGDYLASHKLDKVTTDHPEFRAAVEPHVGGDGVGTITVDKKGGVKLLGTMADSTALGRKPSGRVRNSSTTSTTSTIASASDATTALPCRPLSSSPNGSGPTTHNVSVLPTSAGHSVNSAKL